jgi:hypothetical protein
MLPSIIGSIGWSKRGTSAVDQDVEHLTSPPRYLEAAGGVALYQATHQHHGCGGAGNAGLSPFGPADEAEIAERVRER